MVDCGAPAVPSPAVVLADEAGAAAPEDAPESPSPPQALSARDSINTVVSNAGRTNGRARGDVDGVPVCSIEGVMVVLRFR